MQLYLDSASPDEVREALRWRVLDGVTTNPSLLAKQGGDPAALLMELCELVTGPVSASVTSAETSAMIEEGQTLAAIHERIIVKVPCIPAGIPAIAALADARVAVDATLCFSLSQALVAAKAGARIVSPFIGRLDEAGQDGLTLLGNIMTMYDQYELKTRVLAASLRHPGHVSEAARMGADAATMPLETFRALADHPLSEEGHRIFVDTWRRAQN